MDFEISASNFDYLQSDQVSPYCGAVPYGGYTHTGKNARLYRHILDAVRHQGHRAALRYDGPHEVSFGLHGDQFHLNNPTWLTTDWTAGTQASPGVVSSIGDGTTQTQALWVQDAWKINPQYKLTLGVRGEHWAASDGYNASLGGINATGTGSTPRAISMLPIYQPVLDHTRFSPKGSLQWTPDERLDGHRHIGLANRFPTAKELYNLTSLTGSGVAGQSQPQSPSGSRAQQGDRDRAQDRTGRFGARCPSSTKKCATRSSRKISMSPAARSHFRLEQHQHRPHPQQRRGGGLEKGQCAVQRAWSLTAAPPS